MLILPYTNAWGRFTRRAMSCCNNPLRANQSSTTKCKTGSWSDLGLPRPSSFGCFTATNNSSAWFISTLTVSAVTTTTSSSATTISTVTASAAVSSAVTIAAGFLAVSLHVIYPIGYFAIAFVISTVYCSVLTNWKTYKQQSLQKWSQINSIAIHKIFLGKNV